MRYAIGYFTGLLDRLGMLRMRNVVARHGSLDGFDAGADGQNPFHLALEQFNARKSIEKAALNGGYAGSRDAIPLWDMSKRELIEIAIRLGVLVADDDSPEAGVKSVISEHATLKASGIL